MEDTVEFFNLILGTNLSPQEKEDMVAFLRSLWGGGKEPGFKQ